MSAWMQHWVPATVLWLVAMCATGLPVGLRVGFGALALVLYAVGLRRA